MVCPSCGKHVAGTEARCNFCGAAVKNDMTPSSNFLPPASGGTSPEASEDRSRQNRDARACLVLGIVSFATLPVAYAFSRFFANLPVTFAYFDADLPEDVFAALFATAISAGVLALVLGRRANQAIRLIEGRIFGDDRAKPGMVLGAVGAGIWSLVVIFWLLPRPSLGGGVSAVGCLQTINTGAISYSSKYGHGFPLKLSYLGGCISPEEGDQAACIIEPRLASGSFLGYRFYYVAGPVDSQGMVQSYTVHADPIRSAKDPYYFTDQTGVIRKQLWREANATSPPVE